MIFLCGGQSRATSLCFPFNWLLLLAHLCGFCYWGVERVILYFSRMWSYSQVYAESELSQLQRHTTIPAQRVSVGWFLRKALPSLPVTPEGKAGGLARPILHSHCGKGVCGRVGGYGTGRGVDRRQSLLPSLETCSGFGERSWESFLGSGFLNCQCSADPRVSCCCFLQSRLESMRSLEAF